MESLVPIARTDNHIESILARDDQSVSNILDLFIKSDSGIHIMRAIEPNLRFGRVIRNYLNQTSSMPRCEFWETPQNTKCLRVASRKQIGDALIRYESKQNNGVIWICCVEDKIFNTCSNAHKKCCKFMSRCLIQCLQQTAHKVN